MLLLDTSVVSELRKRRAGRVDAWTLRWAAMVDQDALYISVITLHELEMGVRRKEHSDPSQGVLPRAWLEVHVAPAFTG